MDTVWDLGAVAERPVRVEEGKLFGPGAYDMKGGITNMLWAMRALRALDLVPDRRITVLITSDEEIGSETSRPIIKAEALDHDVVFVLEPAQGPAGSYKTWRKGVGNFQVSVSGRASHAGGDHEKGINAIEELAHQILTIQGFTDYEVGTTFNVGVVEGGSRANVVPAQATAQVDVRVMSAEEAGHVEERMAGLQPQMPGTTVTVTGGVERPPMVRTPQIVALFERARTLAEALGIELTEAGTGGGSDGNFTAALGVPTLDGMGVVGGGAHAADEQVVISSLPERAAVLAAMLRSSEAWHPLTLSD
jgi:glutamate carboxypeptidase